LLEFKLKAPKPDEASRENLLPATFKLTFPNYDGSKVVTRDGVLQAGVGLLAGLAASLALTRILASQLFAVSALDPLTFVSVAAVLIAVATAACYIPARRAMSVDPVVALRHE